MRVADFKRVAKMPWAVGIGLLSQFLILPAVTFAMVWIIDPLPSVGLGMIMVASCPGGNISNFMTHLAKGNTALSVTMTAVSTAASVLMTPLNLTFWGSMHPGTRALLQEISVDPVGLFMTIFILLGLPMSIGLFISEKYPNIADRLKGPMKKFSLIFFSVFIVVALAGNFNYFLEFIGVVAFLVAAHNAFGLLTGYTAARVAGLGETDRRAIAIEVGMQNSGLGLLLIFTFFGGLGGMAIIAAWWGIWHLISGLTLGWWWGANRLVVDG